MPIFIDPDVVIGLLFYVLSKDRKLLGDVCRHLRSGASGLEALSSKIYISGENLLSLAAHAEGQSEANLIHNVMSRFGIPADQTPYHKVSC